jgi:hypothetical protein
MKATTPGHRWKIHCFLGAGAGLLVAGLAIPLLASRDARASRFVSSTSAALRACHGLEETQHVAQFMRTFSDGTWVAAISEHSCSSGAGFEATVFYDTTGAVWVDRTHHFCGVEGLQSELSSFVAPTLRDFYAGLHQCQLAQLP